MIGLIRIELFKLYAQRVVYLAAAVFALLYIFQFYSSLPSAAERAEERTAFATYGGPLTEAKLQWARDFDDAYEEARATGRTEELHRDLRYRAELKVATEILNTHRHQEQTAASPAPQSPSLQPVIVNQEAWHRIVLYIQEVGYLFAGALVILGLAGSFSGEAASGADQLLYSSRHGRGRATWAKLAAGAIYCISALAALMLLPLVLYGLHYGLHGWEVRFADYTRMASGTSFGGSVLAYYSLQMLLSALGCIALGWLTMLLSAWSRHLLIPALLAGMIFLLPFMLIMSGMGDTPLVVFLLVLFQHIGLIQAIYIDDHSYIFGSSFNYSAMMLGYLALSLLLPAAAVLQTIRRKQVT
ncbi:ABC transporter permease [Paenibacillus sp. 598K]|uniref:hypothetical protein n=1 Tax=Paenibacillus sp. 598K TaxID=1117987 RepID=UPI000FF96EF4|nr:hypothetical protein [Paenibacillus sp. 598K]GBF74969.1 ABC transporter permease [Paenibacillus sp. 598K]